MKYKLALIGEVEKMKIIKSILIAVLFLFVTTATPAQNASNTVKDYDGNVYKTVKIGNQVWMAENLRTTRYNDGKLVPYVTDNTEWSNLSTPGYCYYNNDITNKDIYGAFYNWYAVNTGKLAPKGGHIPTEAEWKVLTDYLGGEGIAGGKLKEIGFAVHGSGQRINDGSFNFLNKLDKYWTTTEGGWHSADVLYHTITKDEPKLNKSSHPKIAGHSVRCIKD